MVKMAPKQVFFGLLTKIKSLLLSGIVKMKARMIFHDKMKAHIQQKLSVWEKFVSQVMAKNALDKSECSTL